MQLFTNLSLNIALFRSHKFWYAIFGYNLAQNIVYFHFDFFDLWIIQKVSLTRERISLSLWQAPGTLLRSSEPNSLWLKAPVRGLQNWAENPHEDKPVSVHCNVFASLLSFSVKATQTSPQSHKGSFKAQIYFWVTLTIRVLPFVMTA